MTTHVFIVDSTTFKPHLEYLFAGTGAKDSYIDFNGSPTTTLHSKQEGMLVGMIADASRVRQGDQIIFYLQQNLAAGIFDGKFYGLFNASNHWSFLDNNDDQQYLKADLIKSLTFRTLIEPQRVYADGVSEWEALDEIRNTTSPNQMLWSLIYRKLKANRGNTMITIYEAERLVQLIRSKNNGIELNCRDRLLSFDAANQKVVCRNEAPRAYLGRRDSIDVLPRLISKYQARRSFEPHLQVLLLSC